MASLTFIVCATSEKRNDTKTGVAGDFGGRGDARRMWNNNEHCDENLSTSLKFICCFLRVCVCCAVHICKIYCNVVNVNSFILQSTALNRFSRSNMDSSI